MFICMVLNNQLPIWCVSLNSCANNFQTSKLWLCVLQTPQSTSKTRVPPSPFPMMISMLNDDEWNRTPKSADRSSMPISLRRKSKSVVDRWKEKSQDELVSRESAELCQGTSKRCEMATFQQLLPQPSSNIRSSTSGSVNAEPATPLVGLYLEPPHP